MSRAWCERSGTASDHRADTGGAEMLESGNAVLVTPRALNISLAGAKPMPAKKPITAEKRAYNFLYRQRNSERLKEVMRQWRSDNKEYLASQMKDYRQRNRERIRASAHANYLANAEKRREAAKAWRKLYPEKMRAAARKYLGIPDATRPRPTACEACGRTPRRVLHLDHCHASGKFRGWLCSNCNRALGMLNDNPQFLKNLAIYLEQHRSLDS
jgi:hypothetical protein